MGDEAELDQALTCPACAREIPVGARWCGSCGEALGASQPSEHVDGPKGPVLAAPSPLDEALGVPMVPAPLASASSDDDEGDEADGVDPSRDAATRQTIRVAVAAVLIAVVGLTSVVSRPARPGLVEAAAIGAGDAGGRDAARTGRLSVESVAEPTRVAWSEATRTQRNPDVWGRIEGDVAVVNEVEEFQVLDRHDGTVLWSDRGYVAGRIGDTLVVNRSDGSTVRRGMHSGEDQWVSTDFTNGHVYAIGGEVFAVNFMAAAETLHRLDPTTGESLWQTPFDQSVPHVIDVHGNWAIGEEYRSDPRDGPSRGYTIVQHVLNLSTGQVVLSVEGEPLDEAWGWHQRVALLGGDRVLVAEEGQARIVDLKDPTAPGQPAPDLDANSVLAGGPIVVVMGDGTASVHDRTSLEFLWERADHDASGLSVHELARDPVKGLVLDWGGPALTWLDPWTGEVVHAGANDGGEMTADRTGSFRTQPHVEYRSHDGGTSWTLGGEDLPVDGGSASLRVVDDRLLSTLGESWFVHDLSGRRVRSVNPSGGDVAPRHRGPIPMLARNDGILSVWHGRVRWAPSARTLDYDWTHQMGADVSAAVVTATTVHAASNEILRSLDPASGDLLEQRGYAGLVALSAAGDEALFGLADQSKGACALVDEGGCTITAVRFDPRTLEPEWTSGLVEDACAAPTVGRDTIAVPTVDGATFLSARSGEVIGRWEAERTLCTEAAHDGHKFLLGTDDGLLAGEGDDEPRLLETFAPITTAPVVAGRQVLVGLLSGDLVAIDLDSGEFAWKFLLEAVLLAPPAVHNGTIFVLLSNGEVARLA